MRRWVVVVLGVSALGIGLLTACSLPVSGRVLTPTQTLIPSVTPTPTPTLVPGVPEDVPLMPGAYSVQVMRPNRLVVYRLNRRLADVIAFYQRVLQRYGWQQPSPGDAVVGAAATLMRFKVGGDRLVLSLRYKPEERATIVAISVKRGK